MTKLGITRLPGESEEDFRRRYGREKMRLYRADKPKSDRKRGKGRAPLKNSHLTEAQWLELRQRPGEPDDEYRRRRNRETMRLWRAREGKAEGERIKKRQRYAERAEELRERSRAKHAANPERQREYDRRQRAKDPAKAVAKRAMLEQWGRENRERLLAAKKAWNEANRGLLAHYSAKWRKAARIATPLWADMAAIREFYDEARRVSEATGIPHEVDHIIPLQGKTVCGLHVQTNLRVIPAKANSVKRNRLDHALVEAVHLDVL